MNERQHKFDIEMYRDALPDSEFRYRMLLLTQNKTDIVSKIKQEQVVVDVSPL